MPDPPSAAAVRGELERVLASQTFRGAGRLRRFLEYVTEETLAGRADELKEYSIAINAYGRDASFDPRTSPLVRVDASRLREYYLDEGKSNPLRIAIPKGTYVPDVQAGEEPGGPASETDGFEASIAVLGFENLSGDPTQDFFGDVLTEEIVADLSRFDDLQIIAPGPSHFERGADVREVARQLGARYALRGNVRRSAERIRIGAQLVEVETGQHIWAQTWDRECRPELILELQTEIVSQAAAHIADPLGIVSRDLLAAVPTSGPGEPRGLRVRASLLRLPPRRVAGAARASAR